MITGRKYRCPIGQKEEIMEEAMVIRRDGTGKRFGVLAVLMAAVFLVFMGTHTVYGAGGLDLNTDYPGISVKPGDSLSHWRTTQGPV